MTEVVLTEAGVTADAEQFAGEIAEIAAAVCRRLAKGHPIFGSARPR